MSLYSILETVKIAFYRLRGMTIEKGAKIGVRKFTVVGSCSNVHLCRGAQLNSGCFLVARAKITVGERSALAYGVRILTTADPENELNALYKPLKAPVTIEDNVWIGGVVSSCRALESARIAS